VASAGQTRAEVARNFAAALEKVRQGLEVVVEHDHQAIAVLKPAERAGKNARQLLEWVIVEVGDDEVAGSVVTGIARALSIS